MPLNIMNIILDRPKRIYRQGERMHGVLVVENKRELKHDGIHLSFEGFVSIHYNLKTISFIDTFYGTSKSLHLADYSFQIAKPGKLEPGRTEIPFQLLIDSIGSMKTFYETYQGVFIAIQYFIKSCMKRPLLRKDLVSSIEFSVEYDSQPVGAPVFVKRPIKFEITKDTVTAAPHDSVPEFKFTGQLDSSIWLLSEPINGELIIKNCSAVIRSIELQLVRIETIGGSPAEQDYSRNATEVQNIQIGDGNLARNIPILMNMTPPKIFTCPTLITPDFKIEFEINLIIIFEDNHLVSENFPIKFIRSTLQPINVH